jgi:hypothetical protein
MIIPVLIISAITIAYFWLKLNYQYWKKRGIPGPEPHLLVGNLGKCFLLKSSPGHIYTSAYKYNDPFCLPVVTVYFSVLSRMQM